MIIKVAVPWLKHSPKLGQLASSQTDASLCSLSLDLIRLTSGELTILMRNQSGLRGIFSVGITLIGILATLSAPRSLTPASALYDVAMVTYHSLVIFNGINPRLLSFINLLVLQLVY